MALKPALPVHDLLDQMIGDTSSDYNDGDHPGYYSWSYDQEAGLLTVLYEPDEDAEGESAPTCRRTAAQFRLTATSPSSQS